MRGAPRSKSENLLVIALLVSLLITGLVVLVLLLSLALLLLAKDRASINDDVEVLGVELLAPKQTRTVLLGALIDDSVGVLGNCLHFDCNWLWVLSSGQYW